MKNRIKRSASFHRGWMYVFLLLLRFFGAYAVNDNIDKVQVSLDPGKVYLNLDERNMSLEKLFRFVESHTEFRFFYDKKIVNDSKEVSVSRKRISLEKLLEEISVFADLRFKLVDKVISVNVKPEKSAGTAQAGINVAGQVISAGDGFPLPGVSVYVKGGTQGTMTDADGNYELEVPGTESILVYSYLGFGRVEETVGARTVINVVMKEDIQQLDNVVVTALGIKREEKKLGYSVQRVSGDAVQEVKGVDVATSLTGKVAGLWIQNSTEFDQAPDIRLRGGSSNPLLVVDGVPYGNMSLREIAPDDIESMDVLKGATASALYGSRGSGGAIIITTKSGGNGITVNSNNMIFAGYLALPRVQHSYSAGIGGAYNSIDYVWGNKLDMGIMEEQWNPETKQMEVMELTSRGKNNFKNFLEPGFIANNNISFARSGEIGSVRTSLTHVYNKGQYPNLRLNRLNMNIVGKLKLGDDFELQGNVGYNRSTAPQTTGAGYGDQGFIYQILMWTGPEYDLKKYRDYWVVPNQQQNWHYKAWYDNPYLIAYEKLNGVERNMTNINLTSTYKAFTNAKITARVGYDFYSDETTRRNPPGIFSTRGWHANGMFSQGQNRGYSLNTDFLFNYSKKKITGDFDIDLTAGASMYKWEDLSLRSVTRNGLVVPGIYSLNNSVERPDVYTSRTRKQVNSLFGLASFAWNDAVFIDVTGRNDWSSSLPSSTRSFFYPSVAGSVLINELAELPEWTDLWKVRGSWTVSKKDLGVYATNVNYDLGIGAWDTYNTASYTNTIRNDEDVLPEVSRTWEIGTAAYLFGNRLSLDVAYYNIYNYDRQIYATIPASSGFTSILVNTDETRVRRGVEVTLNAGIIKKEDFSWDVAVNWAKTHQYYKDLDPVYSPDNLWTRPGGRVDNYTGREWLYDPQGNVIHNSGGLPVRSDYTSLFGHSDPDFIWGFTNSFTWKDFDFHLSFDGRVGGLLNNYSSYKMWDTGAHPDSDNKWRYDEVVNGNISYVGNGVQVASGSVTYDQYGRIIEDTRTYQPNETKVSYETYARRYGDGTFGVTDATFVKLREIAIGYTLPKSVSERWGLSRARISLTAQNVFLWAKDFRFADPDFNSDSDLTSPSQRFVGININLHIGHPDNSKQ